MEDANQNILVIYYYIHSDFVVKLEFSFLF